MKYIFSFLLILNASLAFSMQSNHRFGMKIVTVNNTNSSIDVTGMTGIKPRIGEERPWRYDNFGPNSEKKGTQFLINEIMRIETANAIFEVSCPKEMPGWLFAFGTLKDTQEELIAEKIQFSLSGKSKIKLIVNNDKVRFEEMPRKEYIPSQIKTQSQLPIVLYN